MSKGPVPLPEPGTQVAYAYTDGASSGSRGHGGYGAVLMWEGKTEEISGGVCCRLQRASFRVSGSDQDLASRGKALTRRLRLTMHGDGHRKQV